MSESKMISISAMDKIAKEFEDIITVDYYGQELVVKKYLNFVEMAKFINEVVTGCFDEASGMYLPELKTFLAQINTVLYYSNVRLPEDIKHRYDLLTKTDIVNVIANLVDRTQYQTMIRAIEEKISYRVNTNEQLFNNKINTAMSTIETLLNNVKEYFNDITPEDIKNLLSSMTDGKFDEEKLVSAYLATTTNDEMMQEDTQESNVDNDEGGGIK